IELVAVVGDETRLIAGVLRLRVTLRGRKQQTDRSHRHPGQVAKLGHFECLQNKSIRKGGDKKKALAALVSSIGKSPEPSKWSGSLMASLRPEGRRIPSISVVRWLPDASRDLAWRSRGA